jgi:hypothetical protein
MEMDGIYASERVIYASERAAPAGPPDRAVAVHGPGEWKIDRLDPEPPVRFRAGAGGDPALPRRPADPPHIDGAMRHAAHLTWPEQPAAHASMARASSRYALTGDTLGLANVLRSKGDAASTIGDFRRGADMPFSYVQARTRYLQAADMFDALIQDPARPQNTINRQRMIARARERGARARVPIGPSVSHTFALADGLAEAASTGTGSVRSRLRAHGATTFLPAHAGPPPAAQPARRGQPFVV